MTINAIKTSYGGRVFRSRLEARWAVAFDAACILYEYEPEAFLLSPGDIYLPDFYLPKFSGGIYAEVKPYYDDFLKAKSFAFYHPIWLCEGEPTFRVYRYLSPHSCRTDSCERGCDGIPNSDIGVPLYDQADGENKFFAQPGYEDSNGCVPEDFNCQWGRGVEAARAFRPFR